MVHGEDKYKVSVEIGEDFKKQKTAPMIIPEEKNLYRLSCIFGIQGIWFIELVTKLEFIRK